MPKHIYAAAFANEFDEGRDSLSFALETLQSAFEPAIFIGDESPVVSETLLENELSFNSAQVVLDKTAHDDGETFLVLFTKNPSYAGMFLGSLDFLKKQKGLDGKYFTYFVDASDVQIEQFADTFERLFSFVASSYSAALQESNPTPLHVLLKTFIDTAASGSIEYLDEFENGEEVFAEIVRLHFDMNFKEYTLFIDDPDARTQFGQFLDEKIKALKLALGKLVLQNKLDRDFLRFLFIQMQTLEQTLMFFGGMEEDESEVSENSRYMPAPFGACDEEDFDDEDFEDEDALEASPFDDEPEYSSRMPRFMSYKPFSDDGDDGDDSEESAHVNSRSLNFDMFEDENEEEEEEYTVKSRMSDFDDEDDDSLARETFDEEKSTVKSRMCDDEEEAPAANISEVQFSAVSQKKMVKGDYAMIDVLMYEETYRWVVDKALEEARREGAVNETRSGMFQVMANTTVKVVLTSRDAEIIEGEDEKEWFGKHQKFSFVASIPEDYAKKKILFTAYVYFNGALATKLNILADCVEDGFGEIEVERNDIKTAFISYASQDRNTVSMIVQGLKMARPDLNVFFDVESLRSGERWEDQLKNRIDSCDVLYLCWSRNAKVSKWVDFEWRYAYERKGVGCIEPIPLEEPSLCEPPLELSEKHFNDLMLYIRK